MLPIKTILHPTDFSAAAGYAFRIACGLAEDYDARLVVLHVVEPPLMPLAEDGREALRERLRHVQPRSKNVRVEHQLAEGGGPVTKILQLAQETNADVIVMGTHGRRGVGRLLLGSVAGQVASRAPCPVVMAGRS